MAFPMKRMKHPDHGFHIVYSPQEEERMRSNGWVEDAAPAKPKPIAEPLAEPPEPPAASDAIAKPAAKPKA